MPASQGIQPVGSYSASGTLAAQLAILKNILPYADAGYASGTGAMANAPIGAGHLDEMSPAAAVQMRVEIDALAAARVSASGQYTVLTADDTANQINLVTGLASVTLTNCAISIFRAGTEILTARTITQPTPGTIRIADSTYNATAGDIVNWHARP